MDFKSLLQMIPHRRSVRAYKEESITPGDKERIYDVISDLTPLYHDIKTHIEILPRAAVYTTMRWAPDDVIVLYSEGREGYLTNAGFILGTLDLALQAMGIGACYIGLAKMEKAEDMEKDGLEYVIALAVGYTDVPLREGEADFNRKPLSEISDREDERLLPMRLAASSMNTQPWYVTHGENCLYLYRKQISRSVNIARMNYIDVGIALSHLYVAYPDTFLPLPGTVVPPLDGHDPILAFRI